MAPPLCMKKHFGLTPHPNSKDVLHDFGTTTEDYEFTTNNLVSLYGQAIISG